jgi:polyphosphate kinase 2
VFLRLLWHNKNFLLPMMEISTLNPTTAPLRNNGYIDMENYPLAYEATLEKLQIELVSLQRWVQENQKRVLLIFEGRDTAGKGGAIFRFTQYLNPRAMRVVAMPKPTEVEKGQWFFQRYIKELPNPGEMVFFDRSWYNRGVVEPVMGFCTEEQYHLFLQQVPMVEKMLVDDGILLIKFWFSIDIEEQKRRLIARQTNPLKQWKISTIDMEAQKKWHEFTVYKDKMFDATHRTYSPWVIIKGNSKEKARLESIKYVLRTINYREKDEIADLIAPDPTIISLYQPVITDPY